MKIIRWMILTLVLCMATSRPAKGQDMEAAQELQDLVTKMGAADDVCPFMPRLRILVNRIAKSVPEMYEAMKPQLDELNKTGDETCAGTGANEQAAQQHQVSTTAVFSIPAVADAKAAQGRAAAQRQAEQQRVTAQQAQQQRVAQQRQAAQKTSSSASSAHDTYAPALDASCVHALWDASSYGWLAFDNDCGQKISLLVLLNDNTHFGVSSPGLSVLEPGKRLNTTTTREAVQAHKGYTMYACPYPMSAVGPDNKLVEETNVSSYRCWRP